VRSVYARVQKPVRRVRTVRSMALALIKRAASANATAEERSVARDAAPEDVIMTPWEQAYDGIELIALMDANRWYPPQEARPFLKLDPRSSRRSTSTCEW